MQEKTERLMTVRQLAEKLQVSLVWVYQKVKKGELPVVRLSKRGAIRFKPGEIDQFVENGRSPLYKPKSDGYTIDMNGTERK